MSVERIDSSESSTVQKPIESAVIKASDFCGSVVTKIKNNAPVVLDVCSIFEKFLNFVAVELPDHPVIHTINVVRNTIGDSLSILGFYSFVVGLVNPFRKESVDSYESKKSIRNAIQLFDSNAKSDAANLAFRTRQIFDEVMENFDYENIEAVQDKLTNVVKQIYGDNDTAKQIYSAIKMQQVQRSHLQVISLVCNTIFATSSLARTLKNWNILDVGKLIISTIGNNPVFSFIVDNNVFGFIGIAGIVIAMGDQAILLGKAISALRRAKNDEEIQEARHRVTEAVINLLKSGLSLLCSVAPIIFSTHPLLLLGFVLVSKSIGLIILFSQDRVTVKLPELTTYSPPALKYQAIEVQGKRSFLKRSEIRRILSRRIDPTTMTMVMV